MSDLRAKLVLTLDDQLSKAAKTALGGLDAAIKQARPGVQGLGADVDKLGAGRDTKGRLPKGIREIGEEANRSAPRLRGFAAAVAAFNAKIEAGHKRLFAYREAAGALDDAAQMVGGAGDRMLGMVGGVTDAAVGFERAFTDIKVKANLTDDQLLALRKQTMELGAQFGVLPSDVAKGIDVLAAAGQTADDLKTGLPDMMMAAKLGFSDFNTTATVATGILAVYGSKSDDAATKTAANRDMLLQLANAVNASKISMEDLNYGLQDNMTIAKQAGVAYTDLLTMEALLGQKNIKGGVANTATKSLISLLGNPKKDAGKDLTSLFGSSKKAKAVFWDKDGARREVPVVLAEIQKALDGSKNKKWIKGGRAREQLMEHLFGVDAKGNAADIMDALTSTVTNGSGQIVTAYSDMNAKILDTSKSQENINTLMGSSGAKIDKAAASWESFKITMGDTLLPVLLDVGTSLGSGIKWVTEFAKENPTLTTTVMYLAGGFGLLSKGLGLTLSVGAGAMKLYANLGTLGASAGLATKGLTAALGGAGLLGALAVAGVAGYYLGDALVRAFYRPHKLMDEMMAKADAIRAWETQQEQAKNQKEVDDISSGAEESLSLDERRERAKAAFEKKLAKKGIRGVKASKMVEEMDQASRGYNRLLGGGTIEDRVAAFEKNAGIASPPPRAQTTLEATNGGLASGLPDVAAIGPALAALAASLSDMQINISGLPPGTEVRQKSIPHSKTVPT